MNTKYLTIYSISIIFFLLCTSFLYAGQDYTINFDYPFFKGDFYVSGKIFFPPFSVKSERNITVITADIQIEIPTKITVLKKWPDSSIQSAQIIFSANADTKRNYVLIFGDDVARKKGFTQTAILPTVSCSIGGTPKTAENIDLNVGQINVMVDKSPAVYYYWHIIPILLLIAFTYSRSRMENNGL